MEHGRRERCADPKQHYLYCDEKRNDNSMALIAVSKSYERPKSSSSERELYVTYNKVHLLGGVAIGPAETTCLQ
jgi:hypothetical protein